MAGHGINQWTFAILCFSLCVNMLVFSACFFLLQQNLAVSERLSMGAGARYDAEYRAPPIVRSAPCPVAPPCRCEACASPADDRTNGEKVKELKAKTRSPVTLKRRDVRAFTDYLRYENMTVDAYTRELLNKPAGTEHYRFLGYLTHLIKDSIIVEVGTSQGTSAYALASEPSNAVFTFDVQSVRQSISFHHKISEQEVQKNLPNIFFREGNILQRHKEDRTLLLSSQIVLLDTLHFPETQPFEYEFVAFLKQANYSGLLVLDDIFLNDEMKKFWQSLTGLPKFDVTSVGHASGTGILDFSGMLKVED